MDARLLLKERLVVASDAFVEFRIWQVPEGVRGSRHGYKYALAYVVSGQCVIRYDNEAGKGDHKHIGSEERPYAFTDPETLMADFWLDVERWRRS